MARRQAVADVAATGTESGDRLLGVTAAAKSLGVSTATLRRWLKDGRVTGVKVGKQWRIRRSDLGQIVAVEQSRDRAAPEPPAALLEQCERQVDKLILGQGFARKRLKEFEATVVEPQATAGHRAFGLLAKLLLNAVLAQSSDLHVEPTRRGVDLRQRVDGVLHDVVELPRPAALPLIREIKSLSALSLDELHRPQDGRVLIDIEGRTIDIRINTLPATHGEVVAMRILDRDVALPPLRELGFTSDQLERYLTMIHRPYGLALVSGPAGCGKTTTIYASLAELADRTRKIMTAEDPVEFDLDGVTQTQINNEWGRGYREVAIAMLRQAPNIMFVGEIRSADVADLLCQAALTGHLVFSTQHTNDALDAVDRMLSLGVKPFVLSSSVLCVVAQRLVRLICSHCKTAGQPDAKQLDLLQLDGADRKRPFYCGKGCKHCHHTGYRGRTAIYELLEFTREVQEAVMAGDPVRLVEAARASGWRPMREVGCEKILRGETTAEEVIRVTCFEHRARVM